MALSSQDTQAYQQAVSAYINGSYEEAAVITERLIETRSVDPNLQLLLGHIYCCLQRLDAAREHYQIVLESTSDPELVECVNNSLRGINQSSSLQDRSTETARSGLGPVSFATDALAEPNSTSVEALEADPDKNSNSTHLNPASPVIVEPNRAKSDPVFVDPFSGNPASSSNIDVPASHETTQTLVDDYLKNYPVNVYDDLGELPNVIPTETLGGQSEPESALTSSTGREPSQVDSKPTNLFTVPDQSAELSKNLEPQSNAKTQTPATLADSQLIKPQSEPGGAFAGLKNTSLKTRQLLAAIATGIISAAAVMAVSQIPKTNGPQAGTVDLAESGLAAAAAGIAGGVTSFTLGQMTTKRIKRATSDLQAKFDAVLQGDFTQATTYSDDEWGHLAASLDQMIDLMNQNREAKPSGEQAIVNEGSSGDMTR